MEQLIYSMLNKTYIQILGRECRIFELRASSRGSHFVMAKCHYKVENDFPVATFDYNIETSEVFPAFYDEFFK